MDTDRVRPVRGGVGEGMSRRDLLRAGGLAALSGTCGGWARAEPGGIPPATARARSCLLVFLGGGPSHLDTFDPKPAAPAEVRGEFGPIATRVPGVWICEHLPRLARCADRFTIVRSLSHADANHATAAYAMLTGRAYPRAANLGEGLSREDDPHLGSALAAVGDGGGRGLPAFVMLPDYLEARGPARAGQHAGRLGRAFDPRLLRGDPNLDRGGKPAASSELDPPLRAALDLDAEPARLRARYGRNRFGQSVLLGRRLVASGVRFVQVNWVRHLDAGWDTHSDGFRALREDLLPSTDRALAALFEDMAASGLLDETLVVVLGEFGRSPRITASCAGRDHWPAVFSCLIAGAGLPGGRFYGASDPDGAYPVENRITPGQLAATIAFALGVDPAAPIGPFGPISPEEPVRDLWCG